MGGVGLGLSGLITMGVNSGDDKLVPVGAIMAGGGLVLAILGGYLIYSGNNDFTPDVETLTAEYAAEQALRTEIQARIDQKDETFLAKERMQKQMQLQRFDRAKTEEKTRAEQKTEKAKPEAPRTPFTAN